MRFLANVSAWLVGSVAHLARREVRSWTKNNDTIRSLRYDRFRRVLIEGTDHPLLFCLLIAEIAIFFGLAVKYFPWPKEWIPIGPDFENFNLVEFAGVPLGVQVTLVALVYPIVLSFTALMLQRKAQSALTLHVYLIESGVVPAGASSVGLLIVLGTLYFAVPYGSPAVLLAYTTIAVVTCGAWLLVNVLLTGYFLVRTVRFLHEGEQQHAYIRVAVDLALREDLIATAKQYVVAQAPKARWTKLSDEEEQGPVVRTFSWRDNEHAMIKILRGEKRLHDVRLRLVDFVVWSWLSRAKNWTRVEKSRSAVLCFPAQVDRVYSNKVKLCVVENGPPLTFFEQQLIKLAYVFRSERHTRIHMTSKTMLEEMAGQVVQAVGQRHFAEANDRLRAMYQVHHTLLLASAVKGENGREFAATLSVSLNALGAQSYANEWLGAYRDVCRIAVDCIEDDDALFRYVAHLPYFLFNRLPARPEVLLTDALQLGVLLDGLLQAWWLRKSEDSPIRLQSGVLPPTNAKQYENAVMHFVGAWSNVRVGVLGEDEAESLRWGDLTGRLKVYARHFEDTAFMYLRAVARRDEVAASWHLDEYLKWWGGRASELSLPQNFSDFYLRDVTIDICELSWPEAREALRNDQGRPNIAFATLVLNLALRRHWENMRLYLALMLIRKARAAPQADSLELRHAANLIMGVGLQHGGRVEAYHMRSIDKVLCQFLAMNLGSHQLSSRIDGFSERLRRLNTGPMVAGRIYSFSGEPNSLSSLKAALGILLTSLVTAAVGDRRSEEGHRRSKALIERCWRDVDRLQEVEGVLKDLRRDTLAGNRTENRWTALRLREQLQSVSGGSERFINGRTGSVSVTRVLKRLQAVCKHEREITLLASEVDPKKIRELGVLVSASVFDESSNWLPFLGVQFEKVVNGTKLQFHYTDDKKSFLMGRIGEGGRHAVEPIGEAIREYSIQEAVANVITRLSLLPINYPKDSDYHELNDQEATSFLLDVVHACNDTVCQGKTPVVLVGDRTLARYLLSPARWGEHSWQTKLPPGVSLDKHTNDAVQGVVNGADIIACSTPGGDVYVLPRESISYLCMQGESPDTTIKTTWVEESAGRLRIEFAWHFHLSV